MPETTGRLIQMNAHMEMSDRGSFFLIIAVTLILFAAIWGGMFFGKKKGWSIIVVFAVAVLLSIIFSIKGIKAPKDKIIHACADGPVSIESIETVYDIIDVDGKELTLRVRR